MTKEEFEIALKNGDLVPGWYEVDGKMVAAVAHVLDVEED